MTLGLSPGREAATILLEFRRTPKNFYVMIKRHNGLDLSHRDTHCFLSHKEEASFHLLRHYDIESWRIIKPLPATP